MATWLMGLLGGAAGGGSAALGAVSSLGGGGGGGDGGGASAAPAVAAPKLSPSDVATGATGATGGNSFMHDLVSSAGKEAGSGVMNQLAAGKKSAGNWGSLLGISDMPEGQTRGGLAAEMLSAERPELPAPMPSVAAPALSPANLNQPVGRRIGGRSTGNTRDMLRMGSAPTAVQYAGRYQQGGRFVVAGDPEDGPDKTRVVMDATPGEEVIVKPPKPWRQPDDPRVPGLTPEAVTYPAWSPESFVSAAREYKPSMGSVFGRALMNGGDIAGAMRSLRGENTQEQHAAMIESLLGELDASRGINREGPMRDIRPGELRALALAQSALGGGQFVDPVRAQGGPRSRPTRKYNFQDQATGQYMVVGQALQDDGTWENYDEPRPLSTARGPIGPQEESEHEERVAQRRNFLKTAPDFLRTIHRPGSSQFGLFSELTAPTAKEAYLMSKFGSNHPAVREYKRVSRELYDLQEKALRKQNRLAEELEGARP